MQRGDVTEETTRLRSHLEQAKQCLTSRKPMGRALDFILQEILRETNTISAKVTDVFVTRQVVRIKTELERIREQGQNLE